MKWTFKRVWYAILIVAWVAVVGSAAMDGPAQAGGAVFYMLLFTLGWLLFGWLLQGISQGFGKKQ